MAWPFSQNLPALSAAGTTAEGSVRAQEQGADRRHAGRKALRVTLTALPVAATTGVATIGSAMPAAAAPQAVCQVPRTVADALPAIVNITVVKVIPAKGVAPAHSGTDRFGILAGSGATIDSSGIIVTNRHVIDDVAKIAVTFNDKTRVPARLLDGAPLALSVWRHGRAVTVTLEGDPRPHAVALRKDVLASAADIARAQAARLGLQLSTTATVDHTHSAVASGISILIDHVACGSQMDSSGLKPGDAIEQVDGRPATTAQDVMNEWTHDDPAAGDTIALLVRSKTGRQWVTLSVGRLDLADVLAPPLALKGVSQALNAGARPG